MNCLILFSVYNDVEHYNMGMNNIYEKITNFYKYKSLLSELVQRDIKIKYRRSVLGILWSFLDPLLSMIVLTIIFSTLFSKTIPNYPVYYLSGMLTYALFRGGSTAAMRSLVSSSGIWKTIYVPKYLYVLSAVLSNFVTYVLSLVILFAIMLIMKVPFTIYIIFASLPILAVLMFTTGVGLVMGTLNVFFRDMQHLYSVLTLVLMYALPIFYPASIVPVQFRFIQDFNPLYHMLVCIRSCFLYGTLYPISSLIISLVSGLVFLVLGLFLLYKFQDKFVLYV
jgi:lipopolysaccharide transport system permease protein